MGRNFVQGDDEAVGGNSRFVNSQHAGHVEQSEGSVSPQTFLLTNIQGILGQGGKSKAGFLFDQSVLHKSLAVAVTESWMKPEVKDSELLVNFPG